MRCRSISAVNLFKNNDASDSSESENKRIKLTRKLSLCDKHRIILTECFCWCDKDVDLSNKEKLIEIGNILGVEANSLDYIPKSGWKMDMLEL